jgi:hypothetical protein
VILAALACLRALPHEDGDLDAGVVLAEVRQVIPSVVSVGEPTDGLYALLDGDEQTVGWATSTFPQAEKVQGYSGPLGVAGGV